MTEMQAIEVIWWLSWAVMVWSAYRNFKAHKQIVTMRRDTEQLLEHAQECYDRANAHLQLVKLLPRSEKWK